MDEPAEESELSADDALLATLEVKFANDWETEEAEEARDAVLIVVLFTKRY